MQLTYDEGVHLGADDELAPEQTKDIPFLGFVTATVLSVGLWGWIVWVVWVLAQ